MSIQFELTDEYMEVYDEIADYYVRCVKNNQIFGEKKALNQLKTADKELAKQGEP